MYGNVAEWTYDQYLLDFYASVKKGDKAQMILLPFQKNYIQMQLEVVHIMMKLKMRRSASISIRP